MQIYEDGQPYELDPLLLKKDVADDGYELHAISRTGEMVVDDLSGRSKGYPYFREVWQARPTGYPNAWNLAGMDFEFVRSVRMVP
jgi:hypothetical protein